jgi:hypothetical protein
MLLFGDVSAAGLVMGHLSLEGSHAGDAPSLVGRFHVALKCLVHVIFFDNRKVNRPY